MRRASGEALEAFANLVKLSPVTSSPAVANGKVVVTTGGQVICFG